MPKKVGVSLKKSGCHGRVAQTELVLARIAAIYGQWDEARRHALAAVEVYQELRDPLLLNMSYHDLGDIELRAGNLAEARRLPPKLYLSLARIRPAGIRRT